MITFIISEAGFFGVLILAYLFYNATPQSGPGARELDVLKTTIFSICLVCEQFYDLAIRSRQNAETTTEK